MDRASGIVVIALPKPRPRQAGLIISNCLCSALRCYSSSTDLPFSGHKGRERTVEIYDPDLIAAAAAAFVSLVPSLAEEIARSIPDNATEPERVAYFQQKGWAELCLAAKRLNLDPSEFAQQVLEVHQQQAGTLN